MEVLGNLLENAWRLSLQQVRVSAEVARNREASGQEKRLELIIEDDGPGVPEDRRDVILQRGVRADSRTPGQGLGLAVVLDIIEHYDGTLTIDDSDFGRCTIPYNTRLLIVVRPSPEMLLTLPGHYECAR